MKRIGKSLQTGLILACLLLTASCGGQSFVYQPTNDIPPGPGLLSGEDGEFNLFSAGGPKNEKHHDSGKKEISK
ncbi:hypothetical protein [Desulfopila sp. IMCC35008]|uniref:hypothetical protein n=1 Tax=Desulfopila sp. IMCC35008 TaxID=2653858 RepID=UPI0013D32312|nr:hypothetical protein [Desulfopila sp. IMCC35008]